MDPQISVVIPFLSPGPYFMEAVESIRSQTFGNFECLLCDGGKPGDRAYLNSLPQKDARFRILDARDLNIAEALQLGVNCAAAPFIARMDADDVALPGRLEKQLMAIGPDTVLLGCSWRVIDANGRQGRIKRPPQRPRLPDDLLWGCPFLHPGALLRRDAVMRAGGYRATFSRAEDYDLWLRLMRYGKMENLPDILMRYRVHGGNSALAKAAESRNMAMRAQALYLLGMVAPDGLSMDLPLLLDKLDARSRADVILRMLACHAHILGDESEDPAGYELLRANSAAASPKVRARALAVWHLQCAKRCLSGRKKRALAHLRAAFAASPSQSLAACLKYAMGR